MENGIIDNRKKALFVAKKMFAQLVYDFQSLEGMPFTFPEVKTSCTLEGIAAKDENLEPGIIKNGAVSVSRCLANSFSFKSWIRCRPDLCS